MRRLALLLAMVTASISCSSSEEPEWQFGAADAQAALTGTWTGTYAAAGGATGSLTLVLALASPPATTKCGSRTLSTGLTPACIDMTSIALTGALTTSDGTYAAVPMTGTMTVMATTLTYGDLALHAGDGRQLQATWRPSRFENGDLALGAGQASFTLSRAAQ